MSMFFSLCLMFWTMSFILMGVRVRLCLWGLASPVCHWVLDELRRDPSLRMPKAELQLWQQSATMCPEVHGVVEKPNKTHLAVTLSDNVTGMSLPSPWAVFGAANCNFSCC